MTTKELGVGCSANHRKIYIFVSKLCIASLGKTFHFTLLRSRYLVTFRVTLILLDVKSTHVRGIFSHLHINCSSAMFCWPHQQEYLSKCTTERHFMTDVNGGFVTYIKLKVDFSFRLLFCLLLYFVFPLFFCHVCHFIYTLSFLSNYWKCTPLSVFRVIPSEIDNCCEVKYLFLISLTWITPVSSLDPAKKIEKALPLGGR